MMKKKNPNVGSSLSSLSLKFLRSLTSPHVSRINTLHPKTFSTANKCAPRYFFPSFVGQGYYSAKNCAWHLKKITLPLNIQFGHFINIENTNLGKKKKGGEERGLLKSASRVHLLTNDCITV